MVTTSFQQLTVALKEICKREILIQRAVKLWTIKYISELNLHYLLNNNPVAPAHVFKITVEAVFEILSGIKPTIKDHSTYVRKMSRHIRHDKSSIHSDRSSRKTKFAWPHDYVERTISNSHTTMHPVGTGL
jgi:DNA polymerase III delta prime subunit